MFYFILFEIVSEVYYLNDIAFIMYFNLLILLTITYVQ